MKGSRGGEEAQKDVGGWIAPLFGAIGGGLYVWASNELGAATRPLSWHLAVLFTVLGAAAAFIGVHVVPAPDSSSIRSVVGYGLIYGIASLPIINGVITFVGASPLDRRVARLSAKLLTSTSQLLSAKPQDQAEALRRTASLSATVFSYLPQVSSPITRDKSQLAAANALRTIRDVALRPDSASRAEAIPALRDIGVAALGSDSDAPRVVTRALVEIGKRDPTVSQPVRAALRELAVKAEGQTDPHFADDIKDAVAKIPF